MTLEKFANFTIKTCIVLVAVLVLVGFLDKALNFRVHQTNVTGIIILCLVAAIIILIILASIAVSLLKKSPKG